MESASWETTGWDDVEVLLGPTDVAFPRTVDPEGLLDETVPLAPFTLDGGERRSVYVRGRLACRPGLDSVAAGAGALDLRARARWGPTRTIVLGANLAGSTTFETCP